MPGAFRHCLGLGARVVNGHKRLGAACSLSDSCLSPPMVSHPVHTCHSEMGSALGTHSTPTPTPSPSSPGDRPGCGGCTMFHENGASKARNRAESSFRLPVVQGPEHEVLHGPAGSWITPKAYLNLPVQSLQATAEDLGQTRAPWSMLCPAMEPPALAQSCSALGSSSFRHLIIPGVSASAWGFLES